MPGALASHESVARALMILRLTRWLSLVRRHCRDRRTGRILGNLYVLHDEPLTPYEAIQLDPAYLALVSQALSHAGKSVQRVGFRVLQEMSEDPHLAGRVLPDRLHLLMQRLRECGTCSLDDLNETCPQDKARSDSVESRPDSEEGGKTLLRNEKSPSSESEAGEKPAPHGALRNPKRASTVRTVLNNNSMKVRTVPRARESDLKLPQGFLELKQEQQAGVMIALQQVAATQRQEVLDEWAARCGDNSVRNPAGYLYGIIQKAIRGEFKAWAGKNEPPPPSPEAGIETGKPEAVAEKPADAVDKPASPEAVKVYLAQLHSILHQ
jgi:hypothetical protein